MAPDRTGMLCVRCGSGYPVIGGVPWLFREPQVSLAEWRARFALQLAEYESAARECSAGLAAGGKPASTRARLERLAFAYVDQAAKLRQLLAPWRFEEGDAPGRETLQALRTQLPASQGLSSYYVNVHRDYAWGEAENAATLELLQSVLGAPLRDARIAVLGSGAGRLAYDLHRAQLPALTLALDINPLLLAIARAMYAGERVELYEFPIAPRALADQAVLRTLAAPAAADERLKLVAGDIRCPPLEPLAFDAVVTPWLIDIVDEPLPRLAARINSLLREGGRWLNLGSVAFASARRDEQYSQEEVKEIVVAAGFTMANESEREIPYMRSPASRHGRWESTVAWSAVKQAAVTLPAEPSLPDWLVDTDRPVRIGDALQSQILSTRIHAAVLALIDGQRSLADIARLLVDQRLMRAEDALPAVRGMLARMVEEHARRSNY